MSDVDSELDAKEEGPTIGVYEGERNEQTERHGKGKNQFPNGDIYEGLYGNGKRNGYGTYRWKSGTRYVGEYQDNMREGNGFFIYPDGSKYKGEFQQNKRQGQGTYLYANNDVYQGGWENDKKHGFGTYIYASTGSKKKGTWVNGEFHGKGEIIHHDHKIIGNFTHGIADLPAKIMFMNNPYYIKEVKEHKLLNQEPLPPAGEVPSSAQ
ncbi:uncharacterized protein BJ171DRAFT_487114 [Polychytrium aggregatum]|uniref:uncharacterized protein n=1 Tax=Polychytrium aggregatum TaxID=110093 RepID=UPI0022FF1ECB|nr:uncharacterized protein BJ171DRAFT_487114 [Polychytrium aggregatum]KAI9209473.1 hypothetical protein BJ171DRAFT_487114 [Polychytrium aggregatum]